MSDLISRQAAIDAIHCNIIVTGRQNAEVVSETIATFVDRIKALPPAEPKRGRWEMGIDERFVKCSECGLMTTRNELRGIAVFGKNEPNFCPNCGAKMEVTT